MKILLVGANGLIGRHVGQLFKEDGHEIVGVGRKAGTIRVDFTDRSSVRAMYEKVGPIDAVVSAAGEVAFAPLAALGTEEWRESIASKLSGQINLVLEGIAHVRDAGSFTLVSGIVGEEPIAGGAVAATINGALEAFVKSASLEMPRGIRLNIVSPTWLADSDFGPYFPGFLPVAGASVAQAFKKSVMGIHNGAVIRAR